MAEEGQEAVAGDTPAAPVVTDSVADLTTNDNAPETTTTPEGEEPAKVEGAETEATGDEETEESLAEGVRKNIPGSQRLKRRLALIEADHSSVLSENEQLRQRLAAVTPNPDAKPGVDREPTEADFPNDFFEFQNAKMEWRLRQAMRDENAKAQAPRHEQVRRERDIERQELHAENANQVRERIPDYDKVVRAAEGIKLTDAVADELLASDKSALLQYHLAKNPDKVRELNGITSRVELAREIGRLEGRVHLPQAKKATEASPPPTNVRGGAAPPKTPEEAEEMDQYVALRKKQGASFR